MKTTCGADNVSGWPSRTHQNDDSAWQRSKCPWQRHRSCLVWRCDQAFGQNHSCPAHARWTCSSDWWPWSGQKVISVPGFVHCWLSHLSPVTQQVRCVFMQFCHLWLSRVTEMTGMISETTDALCLIIGNIVWWTAWTENRPPAATHVVSWPR